MSFLSFSLKPVEILLTLPTGGIHFLHSSPRRLLFPRTFNVLAFHLIAALQPIFFIVFYITGVSTGASFTHGRFSRLLRKAFLKVPNFPQEPPQIYHDICPLMQTAHQYAPAEIFFFSFSLDITTQNLFPTSVNLLKKPRQKPFSSDSKEFVRRRLSTTASPREH